MRKPFFFSFFVQNFTRLFEILTKIEWLDCNRLAVTEISINENTCYNNIFLLLSVANQVVSVFNIQSFHPDTTLSLHFLPIFLIAFLIFLLDTLPLLFLSRKLNKINPKLLQPQRSMFSMARSWIKESFNHSILIIMSVRLWNFKDGGS